MRKFYVLNIILSMMILCSTSVRAQVASMADLFGKYKFTADVEVTEAGKASEANFVKEGEVVITKDAANIYDAQITGFAVNNGTEAMKVNNINTEKCKFEVKNPNGASWGVFGGLYYSDINGTYPFGEVEIESLIFTYDPTTKSMTCNDFTLTGNYDYQASTCEVFAKFTNVKLTLIEAEVVEISDISGEWEVCGSGEYGTMPGSTLPETYTLSLAKNGSDKEYKATFNIEGIAPFTLDATFNGDELVITYDNVCVDKANNWYIANMWSMLNGTVVFKYSSDKVMTCSSPLVIAKSDGEKVENLQWWMDGSAKKIEELDFTWEGVYTGTVGNFNDFTGGADVLSTEGGLEIMYSDYTGGYYIKNLFGYDTYQANGGCLKLTFDEANPKVATIALNGYYGEAFLQIVNGVYYRIFDANGGTEPLTLTINDDGSLTLSGFYVKKGGFGEETDWVAGYEDITFNKTTTGINSANASVGNAEGMRMFDLSGRSIKSAGNGRLVIIKTADGVKKVFVK